MKTNFIQYLQSLNNISKIILILLLTSSVTYGQNDLCKARLIVDHDLNIGSSNADGAYYLMTVTNTASTADTFTLSSKNINTTCSNTDGSSSAHNINLDAVFVDTKLNPISAISLNPGQTYSFYTHITIPMDSEIKKWCCTQIFVQSKNCLDYKVNTIVHTYYSGPNEN